MSARNDCALGGGGRSVVFRMAGRTERWVLRGPRRRKIGDSMVNTSFYWLNRCQKPVGHASANRRAPPCGGGDFGALTQRSVRCMNEGLSFGAVMPSALDRWRRWSSGQQPNDLA